MHPGCSRCCAIGSTPITALIVPIASAVSLFSNSASRLRCSTKIAGTTYTPTRYYYAGAQRLALRVGSAAAEWLVGDHLGSTSVTMAANGTLKAELRYKPWGQTRYEFGTTATQRRYTGQVQDAGSGLYYYSARYYDPAMGKFIQADTLIPEPGNPQTFNRYAYVHNNPVRYNDPSGHCIFAGVDTPFRGRFFMRRPSLGVPLSYAHRARGSQGSRASRGSIKKPTPESGGGVGRGHQQ
ncbi:MAG: RHS repeat-associated core domain-containing protein [Ardenticatenales bacterium]|nr:RHS repeat-associated core domain-containing protein [Ardenticatenales bacterium]